MSDPRVAMTLTTSGPGDTAGCAKALGPLVEAGDVILLTGDLGAGKTQFTKGLAEGLGIGDPVTSPTFNILLVHQGRLPLYHLDLYRLENADELVDLDYFGVIEGDGVAVVEWGDRFPEALPAEGLIVEFHIVDDERRRIEVRSIGLRGNQLAALWAERCGASRTAGAAPDAAPASPECPS